jgi:hypothetical protein
MRLKSLLMPDRVTFKGSVFSRTDLKLMCNSWVNFRYYRATKFVILRVSRQRGSIRYN